MAPSTPTFGAALWVGLKEGLWASLGIIKVLFPVPVQTKLFQSLLSFLRVSLMILLIVTPIFAHMELLRLYKLLDPLLNPLHRLFGWMRIRKESVAALFVW
jgi:hypothetical protein